MGRYRLRCQMEVPRPLPEVFAVFEDPRNLARITPPWLHFQMRQPGSLQMAQGLRIDYTIRWLGIPLRWRTRIARYEPMEWFVDEQERGPYRLWRHSHRFQERAGGVLVSDEVEYQLPFGILGRLVHGIVVGRQLLAIFRYRQRSLAALFGLPLRDCLAPVIERVP